MTLAFVSDADLDLSDYPPCDDTLSADPGLGLARIAVDSSDLGADDSDTVFAYQFKARLSVPVSPALALVGGYTYFATSDPTIETATGEYQAHTLDVGLRSGF